MGFLTGVIHLANLSQATTALILVASVAYFVTMLTSSRVDDIERTRVRAFIPLFIANAVFWSLFQQIFTVLAVYSDERINWSLFGWTAYGVIGMGVAFLLFLPLAGSTGRSVPVLAVVAIMAVFAVSELLLSPIGLSVTTQLAPNAFRAQMMALFFFSVGLGTAMSGVLGRYYDPSHEFAYFGIIGLTALVVGLVVWALAPRISRLMEGVH